MREIALFSGKIYTAGTNFTRPPVVMVATNLNSGSDLIFISPTGSLFRFRSLVTHSWVLLFNWGNEARVPLLTQSILFPLFSDAIVLLIHILECLLWDMGYEIWVMGLYLGGCSIETMRQGWHLSLRASSSLFPLSGGVFRPFVMVFPMAFCNI